MFVGTHIGRYEICSKLGEGGMGEVYAALDHELDRNVAIKLLPHDFTSDEDRRLRFRKEAKAISSLNHPNIITIYEIGENEHGSYLATEFIEGKTLRDLLKTESLTLTRILKIVEQAATALAAAHQAEIIHRDIKPENIMIRQDSIVKILDFGLAKPKFPLNENTSENRTLPGTVMGSARYMSPEQARGLEVDERTDIWSLGVVLYEMLIGSAPFDGVSTADTIAAVVYKEPDALSDLLPNIPPELNRIVRKSLQKDREERYQSVKDFALDVKGLLRELEHANSGDRTSDSGMLENFSENPTMIHRTVSSNHLTTPHRVVASGVERAHLGPAASRFIWVGLPLSMAALAIAAVFGYLNFWSGPEPVSTTAFNRPQISRVSTDGRVLQPAISPDGKYIAYVSGEFGSRSLVVRQIATDSIITLVPETNFSLQSISFAPSGDHVYYTQTSSDRGVSTLYQVPTLGGAPKRLVDDVDGPAAFSPDGGHFAFVRHIPKTNDDNIVLVDSQTLEQREIRSTSGSDHNFFVSRLAWSPNGTRILAGAGRRQSGFVTDTDVVEIDIDSGELRSVNDRDFFSVNNFAWLSDGSGFVFTGRATQNDPAQIWLAVYPTGEVRQITNDPNDYIDLGIAADGRTIVTIKSDVTGSLWRYSPSDKSAHQLTPDSRGVEGKAGLVQTPDGSVVYSRHEGRESAIYIADADGKNNRLLFRDAGYAVDPALTADGRFIVFNLQKDQRSRIWRMNADGTNAIPLTEESTGLLDLSPQLTPDGGTVIFQRQIANNERFRLMKVSINGGPAELFYEDAANGVFQPRISPDGRRIAFASYDTTTFAKQLHIGTIEGNRFGKIERSIEHNLINGFRWSPDGKELTILSNRGGVQNLWRQPLDGSPAVPITDFRAGRIFNYEWANDGTGLMISRGNVNNDLILVRDAATAAGSEMTGRPQGKGGRRPRA